MDDLTELVRYTREYDLQHLRDGYSDYYEVAIKQDPKNWNALLAHDIQWRKKFRNVIASFEGEQGSGKSIGAQSLGRYVSAVFEKPITAQNLDKHLFYEIEPLTEALDNSSERETFIKDEARQAQYGNMSNYANDLLQDYEQQFRKKHLNMIFASVNLEPHAHYYVFQTYKIELDEKTLFPTNYVFILKTLRHSDGELLPRGLIKFPMPPQDYLAVYDKIKDKHLEYFKLRGGGYMTQLEADAIKIVENRRSELTRFNQQGNEVPVSDDAVLLAIYREIGERRYTTKYYSLLIELIKQKLRMELFGN